MKNFVAVDVGASETRSIGENKTVILQSNRMLIFQGEEVKKLSKLEPYTEALEDSLEVLIRKKGGSNSSMFPVRLLTGSMATRISGSLTAPSVLQHKHLQVVNYASIILAVAMQQLKRKGSDRENVDLYVALPPLEADNFSEIVANHLRGYFEVEFPKYNGGTTVKFNVDNVTCYAESFMAVLSYLFHMDGSIRKDRSHLIPGKLLSVDIGASTVDLAILEDGKFPERSGQTYKTGGNIARDYLVDKVRTLYGFELPDKDADLVMQEGRIKLGNSYEDASKLVTESKQKCADAVLKSMETYFKMVEVPLQTINTILVSGGGSLESGYKAEDGSFVKTSNAMADFILQRWAEICQNIEVISYDKDARLANVKGLYIRASIDLLKKEKANK